MMCVCMLTIYQLEAADRYDQLLCSLYTSWKLLTDMIDGFVHYTSSKLLTDVINYFVHCIPAPSC